MMITYSPEHADDHDEIEALLDACFGPDRLSKSSYSYRSGIDRIWPLCRVARDEALLIGTIRYWPITIGVTAEPALLLGPVAVDCAYQGQGIAARLILDTLGEARAAGHRLVLLVGDAPYYNRFGFYEAGRHGITMARENPARTLCHPLCEGPLPAGTVHRADHQAHASASGYAGGYQVRPPFRIVTAA